MELHWIQPDPFARAYELRSGTDVLATLAWEKSWGACAIARAATGHWSFKQDSVWQSRILVWMAESDAAVATFRAGLAGAGTLEMADGPLFYWSSANLWQVHWIWQDAAKQPLVQFRGKKGLRTAEAEVTIEPAGNGHLALPLLIALGWYLLLLAQDSALAASSV